MTARIACIVIATEHRRAQVWERVVPSILGQGFDALRVVGDWSETVSHPTLRYVCVAPLTRTTVDALVKRDIGTLTVPHADVIVYLCDDHALAPGFGAALRGVLDEPWSVIVPNRYTVLNGVRFLLNNGERENYCAGHAGVFWRTVVTAQPWSAGPHHRNWDVLMSRDQQAHGAQFVYKPTAGIAIEDLNPNDPQHGLPPRRV